ncbi:MAG: sigma-54 dependent transcriptional regulator [Magnetococcus sp. WYHC-3]
MFEFIGRSAPMRRLYQVIERVAQTRATALILGESGTGKELVARAIHQISVGDKQPFIPINCSAIPEHLLEAELFGHEAGAYTGAIKRRKGRFELAGSGVLFLDEIGDMPPGLQVKLLRVLQERVFDRVGSAEPIPMRARVLAATFRDLDAEASSGRFRQDLYFRLNVIPIQVPALRERREDIPLLVNHFIEAHAERNGVAKPRIGTAVMERLVAHEWPGNVRELGNLIERMVILSDDEITLADLPPALRDSDADPAGNDDMPLAREKFDFSQLAAIDEEAGLDFNEAIDAYERYLIETALRHTGGNRNRAAAFLRIKRTTLVEKIKRKQLEHVGRDDDEELAA